MNLYEDVLYYNQMNERLFYLTNEVKKCLNEDNRIISLNIIEKEMNDNEEVMALAYQKDMALDEYNQILKIYSDNSEEANKARHNLYLKKKELESHPLVKKYLKAYQEVRILYELINEKLFSYLSNDFCPKE